MEHFREKFCRAGWNEVGDGPGCGEETAPVADSRDMQTIDNWREWKERCALALCGEGARRALPGFVYARFARYVEAYIRTTNAASPAAVMPDAGESWHRFETHFRLHAGPEGKSYKEWLFSQPQGSGYLPQESVEAGASLLIRDVVREHLRREFSANWMVSTGERVSSHGEDGSPTLEELLPGGVDTAGDVDERDAERTARADAEAALFRLNRRERVALLVREAGLSLAHPDALKVAGCGKSALNDAFHSALTAIAGLVRERHPHEGKCVQASLACLTFREVRRLVVTWAKSEDSCRRFCEVMEAGDCET